LYAIVEFKGFQFKVGPSQLVKVPRLDAEVGSEVVMDKVLVFSDGKEIKVGRPYVAGGRVMAKVNRHGRAKKIIVFKYKRRKDYRRKRGHRTDFTELSVEELQAE